MEEKQILEYMNKLNISRADAIDLIKDDMEDIIGADGEEMTAKAKLVKRYERTEKENKTKPQPKKIDELKVEILKFICDKMESRHTLIEECEWDFTDLRINNPQKDIKFKIGDDSYTLSLTKHKKPKSE